MRLAQRLGGSTAPSKPEQPGFTADSREDLASIATRLHQKILDRLDLAAAAQLPAEELRKRLRVIVGEAATGEGIAMAPAEQAALVEQVLDELVGHGPLEAVLTDPSVTDVLVNGADQVWVERGGKLQITDIRFRDERHLIHTIQRMVARIGRRIDESSPMVDARLPDGSRVNAIVPPLAVDGAALSIRRFPATALAGQALVERGALSEEMLNYLHVAVRAHCSILISGGTGAGKTTMLNALSSFVSKRERVITIEDAAELRLQQPHVVRLEARPPNLEGKGEVTIRDLVKNALRMRPDRIIVGEVRGGEVLDMLQAMNTGHEGSMATIHSNSPDDAMSRLMTMLGMTGTSLAEQTMATMIARAVHVVVQVARMQDGRRRVTSIAEVVGQTGSSIQLNTVFAFERAGTTSDGGIIGRHVQRAATTLTERFRAAGVIRGATSGEIGQ
ncbi:MAG TPA: CpaF family protein [Kofleriaceae bacterium]|nr:CpaF family protein [Kofleriaceae bacterium]